jgi:hypothetical protein
LEVCEHKITLRKRGVPVFFRIVLDVGSAVKVADRGLQKRLPSVLGYSAEPAELGYSGPARARL